MNTKTQETKRNPWLWIPTLYFAEGIPYFIVNNISVLMLAKMGVPNGQMALFTSLLYLPWTIKPFWSPFVDIIKTKRWWVIAMQVIMSVAFVLLTLAMPKPTPDVIASGQTPISMFYITLMLFVITAFASATHDIAADGFYMLALTQKNQAAFVGIRSTFYRLSSIFGQGVLVYIAGAIETKYDNIPLSWQVTMGVSAVIFCLVTLYHTFAVPKPAADRSHIEGEKASAAQIVREFGQSFATFFKKPGLWLAIVFMLLYRLPEAFSVMSRQCPAWRPSTTVTACSCEKSVNRLESVKFSAYVPPETMIQSPGAAALMAACIVRLGAIELKPE